jgi:hypothetical protein
MLDVLLALGRSSGISRTAVAEELGEEIAAAMLSRLDELAMLQYAPAEFRAVTEPGNAAYYDGALDAPACVEQLAARDVMIVGCGALGGEVARHLACSGVRHLTLVDPDVVRPENLNRQFLYAMSDVGRPKVVAASDTLRRIAPDLCVACHELYVDSQESLESIPDACDVVLCCADTPPAHIATYVARFARSRGILFGMATVGVQYGAWGPLVPADMTPSYERWRARREVTEISGMLPPPRASFGPTNSLVAAAFSRDLVHVLLGGRPLSHGARILFNFETLEAQRFPMQPE